MKIKILFVISFFVGSILTEESFAQKTVPAFPGAEGAGMFTTGARGGDIYEVTTLQDSAKGKPFIKGSFRDAVSADNRNIIFKVSGNIRLKYVLKVTGSNLTISGQTAPGDGICIADHNTWIYGSNIILRYLRFRPGKTFIADEPDSITITSEKCRNIIIDHISTSWSTDESLSMYHANGLTVQWCLISESLTMSGHDKGRHGYGGIWGGQNATFHHNLLATHTSRLPRIEVGGNKIHARIDLRNNIIYNWEFNSTYGGDVSSTNMVKNYYKPGPGTKEEVRRRILDPTFKKSEWYFEGNFVEGYPDITADNTKGILPEEPTEIILLKEPVMVPGMIETQNPQTAYNDTLNKVGATYPKRDSVDARVLSDVRTGKGRFINLETEVGGWPELQSTTPPADSDGDGIPDAWEISHKLDPKNPADGKTITDSGYSNLEIYLNSLVNINLIPMNPVIQITSPSYNTIFATGSDVTINATAISIDKSRISKVEFYTDDIKIGESTLAPYSTSFKNASDGTYFLTAKAYDANGLSTSSSVIPVFINSPKVGDPWTSRDIGITGIPGNTSLDEKGVMTIKGSGAIKTKRVIGKKFDLGNMDSFQFTYQMLDGDGELSAKIESISKINNEAYVGIMIRQDLSTDSPLSAVLASFVKSDKKKTPYSAFFINRESKVERIKTTEIFEEAKVPGWIKLSRTGKEFAAFYSEDGKEWELIAKQTLPMSGPVYIGFAVDAAKTNNSIENYNIGKFSNISIIKK